MKNLLTGILCLFVTASFAQSETDYLEYSRSVLNAEKKALVSEALQLSDQQSEVFWPLYNELNSKLYEIEGRNYKIILDYADNYEKMTDEKAEELWKSFRKNEMERQKLIDSYFNKFKAKLPAGLVVRYFQVENKIDLMVDASISLEIPLIEVTPGPASPEK